MIQVCKFNKDTDLQETRPGLACDISVAIEKGAIVDVGTCDEYNGFSQPDQVGSIVRDVFTQIDRMRDLAKVATSGVPVQIDSSTGPSGVEE